MDIDEILERAEKVETKAAEGEEGNELLSAFKACDVHKQSTKTVFYVEVFKSFG
jgi:chromodomain-helicase-DNA-binding protein 1